MTKMLANAGWLSFVAVSAWIRYFTPSSHLELMICQIGAVVRPASTVNKVPIRARNDNVSSTSNRCASILVAAQVIGVSFDLAHKRRSA